MSRKVNIGDLSFSTFTKLVTHSKGVCTINNPKSHCVTFARNALNIRALFFMKHSVLFPILPVKLQSFASDLPENITPYFVNNVDYWFTVLNNEITKLLPVKEPRIGVGCRIHPSVILNVEGIKFAVDPFGRKIQFRHSGDIFIGDFVELAAHVIVHRGTIDSTIIEDGVKVGVQTNIGHNCRIGKDTVIAGAVHIAGSVTIGSSCWIGATTAIKNGVTICNNVIIGMGSLVVKDIMESGIYYGRPVKKVREYDPDFNF